LKSRAFDSRLRDYKSYNKFFALFLCVYSAEFEGLSGWNKVYVHFSSFSFCLVCVCDIRADLWLRGRLLPKDHKDKADVSENTRPEALWDVESRATCIPFRILLPILFLSMSNNNAWSLLDYVSLIKVHNTD